jgi:hypothetical protein
MGRDGTILFGRYEVWDSLGTSDAHIGGLVCMRHDTLYFSHQSYESFS